MIAMAVVFPKLGKNDPKEYIMSLEARKRLFEED